MSEQDEKPQEATESALIVRARNGDASALERLLASHQDRVYRTALGFVAGDEEAAFELAQEVLISAFRHIGQFRGDAKFSTWLYRMTVNFSKNRAVAEGRHKRRFVSSNVKKGDGSDDEIERPFRARGPSAREQAAGNEMMEILHARLGHLSEEFRTVIVLRYIEDRSYEEISEAVGAPIGTVKSRVNRARAELRKLMGDVLSPEGTQS